ncbi:MAG TPA: hypothetical protein VFE21_06785 [Rubrobacteraceae bacterium]|nr:hypothetical protein [Rubrobacteraceae bacterium]
MSSKPCFNGYLLNAGTDLDDECDAQQHYSHTGERSQAEGLTE